MKKLLIKTIFAAATIVLSLHTNAQIINTIAGNGTAGYGGDGGAATNAQLNEPFGAAIDNSGNVYIADYFNHRIRKVNTSGVISTFAGNGTPGFSGDGAAASGAQLHFPVGVGIDGSGNVYIVDAENDRIRKVNTSGVISTIAGNGTVGYSGDGGAATSAQLNQPYGVAIDNSGNVYIADYFNHRIRKVNTSGVISTFAGNGIPGFSGDGAAATSAQLDYPGGVAVDGSGNVYIVDQGNSRIRKVNTSGVISTIAGNGTNGYSGDGAAATSAQLNQPFGVAIDNSGNVYIADYFNHRIRKVNTSGVISTFAGNGIAGFSGDGAAATNAQLDYPGGVAVDNPGNVYIVDTGNNRIRKIFMTTGVTEQTFINRVLIFPNPSKDNFTISFAGTIMKGNVEILNILGENVFTENIFNESKKEINLKNISAGIYFVKVFDGEKYYCKKIIIEQN